MSKEKEKRSETPEESRNKEKRKRLIRAALKVIGSALILLCAAILSMHMLDQIGTAVSELFSVTGVPGYHLYTIGCLVALGLVAFLAAAIFTRR